MPLIDPAAATYSPPISDAAALPPLVASMRARILEACRTGDPEALRVPIDRNEVRPLFERGAGRPPGDDPVGTLKRLSFDGGGRETLLLLRAVLTQSCVLERRGTTQTFIWPAFAIAPPAMPTADERQVMLSCLRFTDLAATANDALPFMRLGIGRDGVWHYFWNVRP